MANENGQEKRETLADIVTAMRKDAELCHDAFLNDPNENTQGESVSAFLNEYARRIEAAWRRERESLTLWPRSWEECIERYKKVREIHDALY